MFLLSSLESYQYELNVNVAQKHSLSGNTGRFWAAEWIPKKNPPVVIMIMDDKAAEKEAPFYLELNHTNIIRTFGFVKNDRGLIMLLQEQAMHGNLQTLLQSGKFQPSEKALVKIFSQIIDAMIYIVNNGVIHGDLRCLNVLVFEMNSSDMGRSRVKLTNFSMARNKDDPTANKQVSSNLMVYCAPEVRASRGRSGYSESSDVYSMGVLMWQACSNGRTPSMRSDNSDTGRERMNNESLSKPNNCSFQLWEVMSICLLSQPESRYNFAQTKIQLEKVDSR